MPRRQEFILERDSEAGEFDYNCFRMIHDQISLLLVLSRIHDGQNAIKVSQNVGHATGSNEISRLSSI
jgi:hypothetical protein